MQQDHSTSPHQGCYHIVRWAASGIFCTIALRRCYRSRSAATTASRRGLIGDRARDGDHLDPHDDENNRLTVVQCRPGCPCKTWATGCNAGNLPAKPEKRQLVCEGCHKTRRRCIEVTDPSDETPRLYCQPCAKDRVLRITFRGRQPILRWRHADEPAMMFVTVWR